MRNEDNNLKLILASQVQSNSLEACYMEGYAHSQAEKDEKNPFAAGSKEHEFWAQGYWAHIMNEAPLFPQHKLSEAADQQKVAMQSEMENAKRKKALSLFDYALYSVGAAVAGISAYSLIFVDLAA